MSQTITCGFVYVTPRTSEQERLQNGFMIRARTVKRNRQEQLLRKGNEQERHTIRKSNVSARKLLPAKDDVDIVLDGVLGTKLDGHELDTNQHKGEVGSDDEQTQGVSYTAHTTNELGNASLTLTTPISPFFGALATSTFGSSSYSTVSEISILGSPPPSLKLVTLRTPTSLTYNHSLQCPFLPRLHSDRDRSLLAILLRNPPNILQLRASPPLRAR